MFFIFSILFRQTCCGTIMIMDVKEVDVHEIVPEFNILVFVIRYLPFLKNEEEKCTVPSISNQQIVSDYFSLFSKRLSISTTSSPYDII